MTEPRYVIRQAHVQAALDKAVSPEVDALNRCLEMVIEIDALERSVPAKLEQLRADAGTETPALSRAAREAVSQSDDARREVDRLLTRRCNRAASAQAVVKEILEVAKGDLKAANMLDNDVGEDEPVKPVYSELYWKKRRLVDSLRKFLADAKG